MNRFENLGLAPHVSKVLPILGYETPTPIQEKSIPVLLQGQDLLAQAQTGTGKTAAFALPILSKLDLTQNLPQALILTPTRELAIQVAEAFHDYAKFCEGFHVLPIYGGQDFTPQLRALKRGVHVIVGTPGRIMDYLRRGSLLLDNLKTVVLDEADEMLKMGFIDDVKWILEQAPGQQQTALFSATMSTSIRNIADQYLKQATFIQIKPSESSVVNIQQFYSMVSRDYKLEALTRFLEIEDFTAAIIFTRTKTTSTELAEKLEARGYSAAAINGDMTQNLREKVIQKLKQGTLDIIVATEVAARGLDIDRISYVISYDIPHDVDSYVHRIGRTGRAGRTGKALVLITPREIRMLKEIERVTKQSIKEIKPPSLIQAEEKRLKKFAEKISQVIMQEDISHHRDFIKNVIATGELNELDIAAALTFIAQKAIKTDESPMSTSREFTKETSRDSRRSSRDGGRSFSRNTPEDGSNRRHSRGDAAPSRDGARSFSRGAPKDGASGYSRGGAAPSRGGAAPSRGGAAPSRGGAAPSRDGARSFSRGAPKDGASGYSRGGAAPSRDGARSFSRGAPKDGASGYSRGGAAPSRDGARTFSRGAPKGDARTILRLDDRQKKSTGFKKRGKIKDKKS